MAAAREALRATGKDSPTETEVAAYLMTFDGRRLRDKISVEFQRGEARARAGAIDIAIAAERAAAHQTPVYPPQALGTKLPQASRMAKIEAASPERMINLVIMEADLDGFCGRPFDRDAWMAAVEKTLEQHDFNRVHHSTVVLACRELADAADPANPRTKGIGMVRWTYEDWARFARCGRSTMHKIIRALWDAGLVFIGNTAFWLGRDRRHGPNVYFPTLPADGTVAAEPAPDEPAAAPCEAIPDVPAQGAVKAMARMQVALRELLPAFPRLVARTFGLNTTPLREASLHRARRESEAPA